MVSARRAPFPLFGYLPFTRFVLLPAGGFYAAGYSFTAPASSGISPLARLGSDRGSAPRRIASRCCSRTWIPERPTSPSRLGVTGRFVQNRMPLFIKTKTLTSPDEGGFSCDSRDIGDGLVDDVVVVGSEGFWQTRLLGDRIGKRRVIDTLRHCKGAPRERRPTKCRHCLCLAVGTRDTPPATILSNADTRGLPFGSDRDRDVLSRRNSGIGMLQFDRGGVSLMAPQIYLAQIASYFPPAANYFQCTLRLVGEPCPEQQFYI